MNNNQLKQLFSVYRSTLQRFVDEYRGFYSASNSVLTRTEAAAWSMDEEQYSLIMRTVLPSVMYSTVSAFMTEVTSFLLHSGTPKEMLDRDMSFFTDVLDWRRVNESETGFGLKLTPLQRNRMPALGFELYRLNPNYNVEENLFNEMHYKAIDPERTDRVLRLAAGPKTEYMGSGVLMEIDHTNAERIFSHCYAYIKSETLDHSDSFVANDVLDGSADCQNLLNQVVSIFAAIDELSEDIYLYEFFKFQVSTALNSGEDEPASNMAVAENLSKETKRLIKLMEDKKIREATPLPLGTFGTEEPAASDDKLSEQVSKSLLSLLMKKLGVGLSESESSQEPPAIANKDLVPPPPAADKKKITEEELARVFKSV